MPTTQLRTCGHLTVKDPAMTGFLLQPSKLFDLVMAALARMRGGDVFIRRMDAIPIGDLAEAMHLELAPQLGVDPDAVAVEMVGTVPGETQHGQIMTARKAEAVIADVKLLAILPETTDQRRGRPPGFTPSFDIVCNCAAAESLALEETRAAIAYVVWFWLVIPPNYPVLFASSTNSELSFASTAHQNSSYS